MAAVRWRLLATLAGVLALAASPARADGNLAWLDVSFFQGDGAVDGFVADGSVLVSTLGVRSRPARRIELETIHGVAHAFMGDVRTPFGRRDLRNDTRLANPYFGTSYYVMAREESSCRIGAGATLPLAGDDDGMRKASFLGTLATQGMWNVWQWSERMFAFVFPLRCELGSERRRARFAIESELAAMFPTDSQGSTVGFVSQLAPEVSVRVIGPFELGARATFVWLIGQGGDNTQLSLEPRARLDFERAYFEARLTLNLDGPFGFAFDRHGLWGVHSGIGVRF